MTDRCDECGLWNIQTLSGCSKCGAMMDLRIEGLSLSWNCRNCNYGVATTANKLCVLDNEKFSRENYLKIEVCPYGKRR